jgi:hypothetical protein
VRGAIYPLTLLGIGLALLAVSAIHPYEMGTWWMKVFPIVIAVPILLFTYRRFPLTPLVYTLILIHACILMVGGHHTYARVPLGFWMEPVFGFTRNNYDRIGHLARRVSFPRSSRGKSCCGARRSAPAAGCFSSSAASAWPSAHATSSSSGGPRCWGAARRRTSSARRGTSGIPSGTCSWRLSDRSWADHPVRVHDRQLLKTPLPETRH